MAYPPPVVSIEAVEPVVYAINDPYWNRMYDEPPREVQPIIGMTMRIRRLVDGESRVIRMPHYMRHQMYSLTATESMHDAFQEQARKDRKWLIPFAVLQDRLTRGELVVQPATGLPNDPINIGSIIAYAFDNMVSGATAVLKAKYYGPDAHDLRRTVGSFEAYLSVAPWLQADELEYLPVEAIDRALESHFFQGPRRRDPAGTLYDTRDAETRKIRMGIKSWLENSWESYLFFLRSLPTVPKLRRLGVATWDARTAQEGPAVAPYAMLVATNRNKTTGWGEELYQYQTRYPVTTAYDKSVLSMIVARWQEMQGGGTLQIEV